MADQPVIITVDGPAASGKGTLCRRLAQAFHLYYLETGAIYRLLGLRMLDAGLDTENADLAEQAARLLNEEFEVAMLENPALRADHVGTHASKSSSHAGSRAALLQLQRTLAANPPAGFKGSILDGRDTGTIVCPDAPLKLYVTASAAVRADRRTKELLSRGFEVNGEAVLKELEARDARDMTRAVAPLVPAKDAVILDTSLLGADEAFKAASGFIVSRFPGL